MKRIKSAITEALGRVAARRIGLTYSTGVMCASATGFFSPLWYLGFAPLAAGILWATYDLVDVPKEVPDGKPSPASF